MEAPNFHGQHCLFSFYSDYLSDLANDGASGYQARAANPLFFDLIGLWIGRCIPSSCTKADLEESISVAMEELLGFDPELVDFKPAARNCHTKEDGPDLDGLDVFAIIVLAFFAFIVIVGTVFDMSKLVFGPNVYPEKICNILMGFSAYANTRKLFDTSNVRPDSLTSITGIRFLSISWVLVGHCYSSFQGSIPLNNPSALLSQDGIGGDLAFQPIENSWPSVDSFFFIGATLLAYITLKELEKKKLSGGMFWTMYYVHRYIRLTAVYSIAILFNATLLKFFATGPQSHFMYDTDINTCRKSWWINLLYLNNLEYYWNEEPASCLGQAWYLANDMQFFVISPLIIYPLWKWPRAGLVIGSLFVVAATVTPMALVWQNDFPFSMSCCNTDFELQGKYFYNFYIVPWTRFQPYILGLLFGYFLHKTRNTNKMKMNPLFIVWMWGLVGAVGSATIYGLYDHYVEFAKTGVSQGTLAERVAYNCLHRIAWSICVGWVILACTKKAGGPIGTILSWKLWVPLARLSYCIYIVHLSIIYMFTSLIADTVHFSQLLAVYWCLAMLCVSIAVAYIAYIFIELPCVHLEKLLFALLGVAPLTKPKDTKKQTESIVNHGFAKDNENKDTRLETMISMNESKNEGDEKEKITENAGENLEMSVEDIIQSDSDSGNNSTPESEE